MGDLDKQKDLGERYIQIQMAAILLMIEMGVVKDAKEYVEGGHGEGFHLWITGALKVPRYMDWTEIKQRAMEVVGQINNVIK